MTRPMPDRLYERVPGRYRERVPPEIPALWRDPRAFSVFVASAVSMFALAIFPPFLSPGAEAIQRNLREDPGILGLVVIAGIALGAGTLLVGGAVGDVDGHRRWLLIGLTGLLGSCLFGLVFQNDRGIIIAGLLGAFWSSFALPMGIAVVADVFPERAVQDVGIGLSLAAMGVAQLVAPVIQDFLFDNVGVWAIYVLPIAAGALAFVLVGRRVPEVRAAAGLPRRRVIYQSLTAAIPLTVATFLIVLLPGEADALALAGLTALGIAGLVVVGIRRRSGRGILPAGTTPSRMVLVALFVGVFMAFAVNAPLLYFGAFLRVIRGWGEWLAAAAILPHVLAMLIGGLYAPVATRRFGYVPVIIGSMLLLTASTAAFALAGTDSSYVWFVLPLATLGVGMVVGATARAGLIMSRMPTALPGLANAINLASMELGAILGQTVMTVLVMRFATQAYAGRLAAAGVSDALAADATGTFRTVLQSVQPGGTTTLYVTDIEGLLPGFHESMADGIGIGLWLVTIATLMATFIAVLLFRWADRKDERPERPIQADLGNRATDPDDLGSDHDDRPADPGDPVRDAGVGTISS